MVSQRQAGGQTESYLWRESQRSDVSAPFSVIVLMNKQSFFPAQTESRKKGQSWHAGRVSVCICVTLQVSDRVQGRLVSGSWTPQCLLGSNTLPIKRKKDSQKDSSDWY